MLSVYKSLHNIKRSISSSLSLLSLTFTDTMEASSSCFLLFLLAISFPLAQFANDQACISPLESLLDCLAYAQGNAQMPSPACCSNMKTVFDNQKKCLCELIAASAQGQTTGLPPINQTLALKLPVACGLPADPSKCPGKVWIIVFWASSPQMDESHSDLYSLL